MAQFLRSSDPGFAGQFKALVNAKRDQLLDVQDTVRAIIRAVRDRGDAALMEFTQRFDKLDWARPAFASRRKNWPKLIKACPPA